MDSAGKIVTCMQKAAEQVNLQIPSADEVKHIIGISLVPAIKQLFGVDEQIAKVVAENYKQQYISHDHIPVPLFDGAHNLLTDLSSGPSTLAVATGKARVGLQRAFAQTDTEHFFSLSRCADEAQSKPHPDMLIQILYEVGLSEKDAVMVGDTTHDMAMAEAIGMDRVAVSYGAHTTDKLEQHQPTEIVHSVDELGAFLKQ